MPARPPAFTTSTITYKVVVYSLAERADTLLLFLLYLCMYSLAWTVHHMQNHSLLGHSPPASHAGHRVGPAL
jgi:hypothetical protein